MLSVLTVTRRTMDGEELSYSYEFEFSKADNIEQVESHLRNMLAELDRQAMSALDDEDEPEFPLGPASDSP